MDRSPGSLDRALFWFTSIGGIVLVLVALVGVPSVVGREGWGAQNTAKLFFFHVPVAITSFVTFFVALVASIQYLRTRKIDWDRHARSAVEVGVLYTGVTLATGFLWARAEWGADWQPWQDDKLVTVLVLFLVYAAYLILRRQIPNPETRRRVASVFAIAGFAGVPLAYFADRILDTVHRPTFGPGGGGVSTPLWEQTFLFAFVLFVAVYAFLHRWRARNLMEIDRLDALAADRRSQN